MSRYGRGTAGNTGRRFLRDCHDTFSDTARIKIKGVAATLKREEPSGIVGVEPPEEFIAEIPSVASMHVAYIQPLLDGMLQDGENQATLAGPFQSGRISPLGIQHNIWNEHRCGEIAGRDGDFSYWVCTHGSAPLEVLEDTPSRLQHQHLGQEEDA